MSKRNYVPHPRGQQPPPRFEGNFPYSCPIPGVDNWQQPMPLLRHEAASLPPPRPFFQNTPPTISWLCACQLCVDSVEKFMSNLRLTGTLYSSFVATSGPVYNSLLTNVMESNSSGTNVVPEGSENQDVPSAPNQSDADGTDGASPESNGNVAPPSANSARGAGSSGVIHDMVNNNPMLHGYGEAPSYFYYSPHMNYASPFVDAMPPPPPPVHMPYFGGSPGGNGGNYPVNMNWMPYENNNGMGMVPNHLYPVMPIFPGNSQVNNNNADTDVSTPQDATAPVTKQTDATDAATTASTTEDIQKQEKTGKPDEREDSTGTPGTNDDKSTENLENDDATVEAKQPEEATKQDAVSTEIENTD